MNSSQSNTTHCDPTVDQNGSSFKDLIYIPMFVSDLFGGTKRAIAGNYLPNECFQTTRSTIDCPSSRRARFFGKLGRYLRLSNVN